MTVHFFTFSDATGGSSRQRAFRIVEKLQERGVDAITHWPPVLLISHTPWPKKNTLILAVLRSLRKIKKDDVVYLQRAIANKYFFIIMAAYLLLFRRRMIFDIDDPIYLHSFFKTKVFTKLAHAVITCTHAQAEWAKRYNKNVHIVHIALDFPAYQKFTKIHHSQPPFVLGWIGAAPEHYFNLKLLVPVFKRLLTESSVPFKFTLIGSLGEQKIYDLFDIPGLNVEFVDQLEWRDPEAVPREIQKFDIALQPHELDGVWNRAKTSLKILEYMACGLPTVSSPFGEMPYLIQNGTGYLAESEHEWVEKLKQLFADPQLRDRLGRAGQEHVREHYSYEAVLPRIVTIIRDLEKCR